MKNLFSIGIVIILALSLTGLALAQEKAKGPAAPGAPAVEKAPAASQVEAPAAPKEEGKGIKKEKVKKPKKTKKTRIKKKKKVKAEE